MVESINMLESNKNLFLNRVGNVIIKKLKSNSSVINSYRLFSAEFYLKEV